MQTLTRLYISLTNLSVRATDEDGATAVEYALLVSLIAGAIIVIVGTLGGKINSAFTSISGKL